MEQQDTPSLVCEQVLLPPARKLYTGSYNSGREQSDQGSTSSPTVLTFSPRQPAWECAFSCDGVFLAVAYGSPDPVVRIFKFHPSTGEWKLQSTLPGIQEKTIRSVAFAPTVPGSWILASASFDGTIAIWEPDNPEEIAASSSRVHQTEWISMAQLEGHDTEVKCVRWNATGSLLATCGRDKSVWIWECFLPGTIGGQDAPGEQFECLSVLHGHEGDVKCVRFAPSHGEWGDGDEILLSASYDDTIKCWAEDAGDWYCAATLSGIHTSTIWSLALAPSGARLVAGSEDGSISIHKCYTNQEKKQQFPDQFAEDQDGTGLWKCVGKLEDAHPSSAVYCVDYAPARVGHGRIASCGGDNRIQILREAPSSTSDRPLFSAETDVVTDHGDVNCVAWHPLDGSVLVSAGDDGHVRIWKYRIT